MGNLCRDRRCSRFLPRQTCTLSTRRARSQKDGKKTPGHCTAAVEVGCRSHFGQASARKNPLQGCAGVALSDAEDSCWCSSPKCLNTIIVLRCLVQVTATTLYLVAG